MREPFPAPPVLCRHCGTAIPTNDTGRPRLFCSINCRVATHRAEFRYTRKVRSAPRVPRVPDHVTKPAHEPPSGVRAGVLARTFVRKGVVVDSKWPGMFRVRLPDGTLSALVNLSRANDLARDLA